MSEQAPQDYNQLPDYRPLVEEGLRQAEAQGFNLEAAIAANGQGEQLDATGREHLAATAARVAEQAELDQDFFSRPAAIVLLAGVTHEWIGTEQRAQATAGHDERISQERAALADMVLLMAGKQSGVVRRLVESDPTAGRKFLANETNRDPDEAAFDQYCEDINDPEIAAQVEAVLADRSESSFLHEARTKLNLDAASERPVRVLVIKMAESRFEFTYAGHFQKIEYPSWDGYKEGDDATRQAIRDASKVADDEKTRQEEFAAPYLAARKGYDERFAAKLGPMPPAFVHYDLEGNPTITLTAPAAMALLNKQNGALPSSDDTHVQMWFPAIEHEFKHTQRWMGVGPDAQIGLMLEERAAELVGRDKGGYTDIKHLMNLLTFATGVNVREQVADAIRQDDPLSAFMCSAAQGLGLRTLLLLATAKPLPYEKMPNLATRFASQAWLRQSEDSSSLDAIFRDTVERHGMQKFETNARAWAQRMKSNGTEMGGLMWYVNYSGKHGLQSSIPLMERLISEEYAASV